MNQNDYSPEQRKDIEERVEKAKTLLQELYLQPGVIVQMVNQGNDVFGIKPMAYLQDMKYKDLGSSIKTP